MQAGRGRNPSNSPDQNSKKCCIFFWDVDAFSSCSFIPDLFFSLLYYHMAAPNLVS